MPQPTDSDIYSNPGISDVGGDYYPGEPEERKVEEIEDQAPIAGSYPIMPDVAAWFAEQIADCDNIHNIQTTVMKINGSAVERTVSIEGQVLAYQLLKEKLQEKFNTFKEFAKDKDDE